MIGEENNMSILERPGDTGNGELDLETWSDHETLVGEEDPGEGSSSDGNQPCLRPEVRTDLATGVNPVCGPVSWTVFRAPADMVSFAGNPN